MRIFLEDVGFWLVLPLVIGLVIMGLFYAATVLGLAGYIIGAAITGLIAWTIGMFIIFVAALVTQG